MVGKIRAESRVTRVSRGFGGRGEREGKVEVTEGEEE